MGYGAVLMFERGRRLSGEESRKLSKTISAYLMTQLKNLGKKKPDKTTLQETIIRSLDEAGLNSSPSVLDNQMNASDDEIVIDQVYPDKDTMIE